MTKSPTVCRLREYVCAWIVCSCLCLLIASCFAEEATTVSAYHDPVELVRKAVQNEIKAANDGVARFLFRGTKTTPSGSTTRLYIESNEATAGLVIGYNDKPLTPEQRHDEEDRVNRFITDPAELKKKRDQERENAEHTMRIICALPDAFQFEYAGEESGSAGIGRAGAKLVILKFRPNPKYQPPSRVEEVLTGMQGEILIDPASSRLASIDGTLFRDVSFGWGIFGHLNRGGHFVVRQQAVDDDSWEISSMALKFNGKILLFKTLSIDSSETFTNFKRVPADLTFAQAVELLKKEESSVAAETICCQHTSRPINQ